MLSNSNIINIPAVVSRLSINVLDSPIAVQNEIVRPIWIKKRHLMAKITNYNYFPNTKLDCIFESNKASIIISLIS